MDTTARQRFRRVIRYSKVAGDIVDGLNKLREGGPLTRLLGTFSVAGRVATHFIGEEQASLVLTEKGYFQVDSQITQKVCRLLMVSSTPRETRQVSEDRQLLHEFVGCGAAVLSSPHGTWLELFLKPEADLAGILAPLVWRGPDLAAYFHEEGGITSPASTVFDLAPMGSVKPYVGVPSVGQVVSRLGNSEGMRTCLLVGPTGSGKTTLARLVAGELRRSGDRGGLLKVAAHALSSAGSKDMVDAVQVLAPSAVLIDDIPLSSGVDPKLLDLFEALDSLGSVRLVLGTLMVDDKSMSELTVPGGLYWPGMRPGRIDEVIWFPPPDAAQRARVLSMYLERAGMGLESLDELVGATEGLTGAYLSDLVRRLSLHGMSDWETEVERLRWQAPVPGVTKAPTPPMDGPSNGKVPSNGMDAVASR